MALLKSFAVKPDIWSLSQSSLCCLHRRREPPPPNHTHLGPTLCSTYLVARCEPLESCPSWEKPSDWKQRGSPVCLTTVIGNGVSTLVLVQMLQTLPFLTKFSWIFLNGFPLPTHTHSLFTQRAISKGFKWLVLFFFFKNNIYQFCW